MTWSQIWFFAHLDERVKDIAESRGLTYSRCMDGFVVAGNHKTREALGLMIQEILKSGLAVRRKKTTNAGAGKAQMVVGYNVNTPYGPKVCKAKVQEIRTDVHQLVLAHDRGEDVSVLLRSVRGSLAYLGMTNHGAVRRLERQLANAGVSL